MSDIPTDAFREILSRVPPESLPGLRRVCKAWRRFIDDPAFFEQIEGGDRLIICKQTTSCSKLHSLYLSSFNSRTKRIEATCVKNLIRRNVPPVHSMPLPSCHGLILLCGLEIRKTMTIWNPFIKEFLELPPCHHLARGLISPGGGIGYDFATNDYKVVRVSRVSGGMSDPALETLIYSVKSNRWRRVQNYPNCSLINRTERGLYFKGALYWFAYVDQHGDGDGVERIIALDLGTEKYTQLSVPLGAYGAELPLDRCLEASGGSLFVSYSYGQRFDVWMWNDQGGGGNIWNKLVSLDRLRNFRVYFTKRRLISYSKSKKEVVIWNEDELLWIDLEKKRGNKVCVRGFLEHDFSCQAFPLSLVRLKGISHTHGTTAFKGTLKRKRPSSSDRLTLKLKTCSFRTPSDAEDSFDIYEAECLSNLSDGEGYFDSSDAEDYFDSSDAEGCF